MARRLDADAALDVRAERELLVLGQAAAGERRSRAHRVTRPRDDRARCASAAGSARALRQRRAAARPSPRPRPAGRARGWRLPSPPRSRLVEQDRAASQQRGAVELLVRRRARAAPAVDQRARVGRLVRGRVRDRARRPAAGRARRPRRASTSRPGRRAGPRRRARRPSPRRRNGERPVALAPSRGSASRRLSASAYAVSPVMCSTHAALDQRPAAPSATAR